MRSLYMILLLASAFFPLVLSFDRKVRFYKQWKLLLPSIFLIAALYVLFDIILAEHGVWGFNPEYHLSIVWLGLPLEEYLFFIVIPYASIFLHDCIITYFPSLIISDRIVRAVSGSLIIISFTIIALNTDKAYTVYIFSKLIVVLLISFFDKSRLMNRFYITFIVILIPFVMINGILTGSLIDGPVVWYNEQAILGIRMFTIPFEDLFYAFSLIVFVLLLRSKLNYILMEPQKKTV